jgi:hypothetical protein
MQFEIISNFQIRFYKYLHQLNNTCLGSIVVKSLNNRSDYGNSNTMFSNNLNESKNSKNQSKTTSNVNYNKYKLAK